MEMKLIKRDANGLIEGVNYVFKEDGTIDWRKMIKPEYLVVNKQNFERRNQPIPESIEGLEDKDLLILLAGIKDLARLRGYTSVTYNLTSPSPDYVAAVCLIFWIPNYEVENRLVTFSGIGDACPLNTNGFGRLYLGPIAENRAFVRAVRNFLGINIVGQDEIQPNKSATTDEENPTPKGSHTNLLEELMAVKKVTFEQVKEKLIKEGIEGAADFTSVSDIPKIKMFELIERLKKKTN